MTITPTSNNARPAGAGSTSSGATTQSAGGYAPAASWSDVQSGEATLSRGVSGESVAELQQRLNDAGMTPALDVDGKLGPKTEAAIRRFQAANGLCADGACSSGTLATLERGATFQANDQQWRARTDARNFIGSTEAAAAPTEEQRREAPAGTTRAGDLANAARARTAQRPTTAATTNAFAPEAGRATGAFGDTRAEREQQAEQILRANGQWPPVEGRTYAIQIDQDAPPADASRRERMAHLRSYSGQTSVFRAENGRLQEVTDGALRSASHPGQASTRSRFTDVNGDGNADIAHLRAGVYDYRARANGAGRFNPVDNDAMTVARDTNQDGAISAAEAERQFTATALQWHAGNPNNPVSVGCQTMPPDDYRRFSDAVSGADGGRFTYVLVRRPNDEHGANPL